jgi:hypothetical protein
MIKLQVKQLRGIPHLVYQRHICKSNIENEKRKGDQPF